MLAHFALQSLFQRRLWSRTRESVVEAVGALNQEKETKNIMQLFQLLSTVEITHFGQTFDVALNWIGKIISALIGGVGIVGVGIILFSVILKIIVLPFDVYQRITMRKQNIKMKENQDKMEKLQKQYANNKEMYNQKVLILTQQMSLL